jgi:ElaB/YqjD/DUF883 family membrane-anchored ribosome-binding protein
MSASLAGVRLRRQEPQCRSDKSAQNILTYDEVMTVAFEDVANSTVRQAIDQGRQAAETASQSVKDGYQAARQNVQKKGLEFDLRDFVRREPWIAVAGAFAIGYVASQIIRRVS